MWGTLKSIKRVSYWVDFLVDDSLKKYTEVVKSLKAWHKFYRKPDSYHWLHNITCEKKSFTLNLTNTSS